STILVEDGDFPTDRYVAQGLVDLLPRFALRTVAADAIAGAIDRDTAAVMLSHVNYRSGARHDMAAINAAAHAAGALTVWDLSHSAGAMALDLNRDDCDLAVGCGYKYLNGGPGAPAFLFVAERLQDQLRSPLQGWMGHAEPFAFEADYRAAPGIAGFLSGTPSILALAALESGLDTFAGLSMSEVEAKAQALLDCFIGEVEALCGAEVTLASPRDPARRGSHVSFAHPHGYALMQALIERGVTGDFRAPDLIRFGFAPLYNSYEDAWRAAEILGQILAGREWDQARFGERARVT
ncbi:MAG: aminotransferase class V-fold PLP-dependent enzyme, partial [Sphingomicrobium sp.]